MAQAGRRSRPGDLYRRRVVLLAESAGLAAMLGHVLGPADRLSRLDSLYDAARSRLLEAADVVVLDPPDKQRASAVRLVRRRYRGPLVVLAGQGETGSEGLDDACILLARPFSVEELRAALAGQGLPPPPKVVPPAVPATASAAALPRRRDLVDRAQGLVPGLVEGWRTRRRVRVAGVAALALLAFTAAFVVAAQGRCGPGCDRPGTGLSPAPTITSVESRAVSSSRPRKPTSTTTIRVGTPAAGTPGVGAFLDTSDRRRATAISQGAPTTTTGEPTTTRRPVTTRPATTRPATTQSTAPPTTAPTTTVPVTTAPPGGQGTPGPAPTTVAP